MLRGVIFDLDGTLGDTLPVCYHAFREVFRRRLGVTYTDREVHAMFGPSEEGILARLCPDDPDGALGEYLAEYELAHDACPGCFPGILPVLDDLAERGSKLAIVTGKGPRSARISLRRMGLGGRFPLVEAGSPVGGVKPEAMRRVLSQWRLDPSMVAGVGDAASDIRAARSVGIRSVAAAWAPRADSAALAAANPDELFTDANDFRSWLAPLM